MSGQARLRWRCRRGMLELDALLQGFVDAGYDELDAEGRRAFEALLEHSDAILLEWMMGRMTPTDAGLADVVERIRRSADR